jgi:DNA polymerase III subunit epsilon
MDTRSIARQEAHLWAKNMLAGNPVILDFETTGVRDAEIVQIGAVDKHGTVLLNTLIKPIERIPAEVIRVHGITNEVVKDAPGFKDVYVQLSSLLAGATVVAYNADFEKGILNAVCKRHTLPRPRLKAWECAMKAYAKYWGQFNPRYGDFTFQKLTNACAQQQIEVAAAHSGAGDALMTLRLIEAMARG